MKEYLPSSFCDKNSLSFADKNIVFSIISCSIFELSNFKMSFSRVFPDTVNLESIRVTCLKVVIKWNNVVVWKADSWAFQTSHDQLSYR